MGLGKCPGQDKRFWTSEDAYEAPCPRCGTILEFWKTEPRRRCYGCGKNVLNPKLDLECDKWCAQAADGLGFRIIWDADRLANAPEECAGMDRAALARHVQQAFRTEAGRSQATYQLLAKASPGESPGRDKERNGG